MWSRANRRRRTRAEVGSWLWTADHDPHAAAAVAADRGAEPTGDRGAARRARVAGQTRRQDRVPVALDHGRVALRAERGVAFAIVNVAGVDVREALAHRPRAGALQRRLRCRREIDELVVWMKRAEVERD